MDMLLVDSNSSNRSKDKADKNFKFYFTPGILYNSRLSNETNGLGQIGICCYSLSSAWKKHFNILQAVDACFSYTGPLS